MTDLRRLLRHPNPQGSMNQHSSQTRHEVMAEIIKTGRAARNRGADPWKAIEAAYPGIPSDVVADAWVQIEGDATEAWWQTVERTIDGEIIRNALTTSGQR